MRTKIFLDKGFNDAIRENTKIPKEFPKLTPNKLLMDSKRRSKIVDDPEKVID